MFDKYFEEKFNDNKSLLADEKSLFGEKISILVIISCLFFFVEKLTEGNTFIF